MKTINKIFLRLAIAVMICSLFSCSTTKKNYSKSSKSATIKETKAAEVASVKKVDSIIVKEDHSTSVDTSETVNEKNTVITEETIFVNDTIKRVTKKTAIQEKQKVKKGVALQNKIEEKTAVNKVDTQQSKIVSAKDSTVNAVEVVTAKKKVKFLMWQIFIIPVLVIVYYFRGNIFALIYPIFKKRI